jgi:hypothetical protein
LVLGITLSLPVVQTRIGEYVTDMLRKDYKADINVEQVAVSIFGGVKLKNVLIRDHHKLNMISAKSIKTNVLSFQKLYNGDLLFGEIRIDSLFFNLTTYKGDKDTNIGKFASLFDSGKPSTKPFLLKSKNVYITNSSFLLSDENSSSPKQLDFKKLNIETSNLKIYGPEVTTNILKMSFLDHRGIAVDDLKTNFAYTLKHIKAEQLSFITKNSFFNGNAILNYNGNDFADFNNKVEFNVKIDSASIASNDVRYFYKELGVNQHFKIKSIIKGTLNDLYFSKLNLVDRNNTKIIGNINFKNLLGTKKQPFYMRGNFNKLTSNYKDLVKILPNILGKSLPSTLGKLGQFDLRGKTEITTSSIGADFYMTTSLGNLQTNLKMTNINNIDNASYKGNIILEHFKIGKFLDKKDLDFVTLNVDIDGKGFKLKNLNTSLSGDIYKINYKGYNYTNIVVNGNFKKPIFKGKLNVNDPNLFMDFDGLVDLEKKDINYNFNANIDYANLKKLNLVQKDSVSVFKGSIDMRVTGTNLDNVKGSINIKNTSYQNEKETYYFDDFDIKSSFDDDKTRTISINSPDIVQGKIVGKFQINQLQKMIENSLGSLYANYKPNKIIKGQFLKFNFSVYNKIIDVFLPGISLAPNTLLQGSINSDRNDFKFNFDSPKITAYGNNIHKINIRVDNKNPLYNAYVSLDSLQTKNYKISDFSMINVIKNDTLFVRSEFKGGNKADDYYKLNVFHTINKENNNVVGIQKSEVKFKDVLWYLNEKDDDKNKLIFDKRLSNFSFDDFSLSHENQKVAFKGFINDKFSKDLNLNFTNIDINKLTPEVTDFTLNGVLNGNVNFKQNKKIYLPTASLFIDNLSVNKVLLGKLNLDIEGDNELKKFNVNSSIVNENVESFNAKGEFNIENQETKTNLDLHFNKFNLGILGLIGGDIITNIKGFASGSTNIQGIITNPTVNGRMYLEDSGISIPYLNVNYEFENNSIVDITENSFIVRNVSIIDSKFKSKGVLDGRVKHNKFSDWFLDLKVKSDRFLALDTKDRQDAAYFGTAFIDGVASISGPSNGLIINIDAKSEKGTAIKIPINDVNASGTNDYIHFLTSKEKYNIGKGVANNSRNYNGLELKFNLDINQKAEIEVILNRNSGHGMKGRGNGNLLLEINTLGKFIMTGDFQVYEGTYNFKYGGLIDKKFKVKKFGSIVWEGDPLKANINLEAVYETTANPAVLLDNTSVNKKVPVEVVIGIKGNLSNVEPDFSINFPTVSSVLKSEIQYKLDDRDTRQKQALYLLSSGGFLSQLGISQTDLTGNIFEKFSGIFNDIFQDEEGKFNLGIDYVLADKRPGTETDGRFGVTVSSKINDRITFNGKLGVPVGGINQSAVVGDVEVQYRVNEDGTLNLRVFNKENDITYLGQSIGYTQGLGLSYQIDFNTFKELVNKLFKKKILAPKENKSIDQSDSDVPNNAINFKTKKNKSIKNNKVNSDAILNKEGD